MEYLEGETLAHRLEDGPLEIGQVLLIAIELLEALAYAHARGIVHRDLKPGNVMLTNAGAKLLDFGIATLVSEAPGGNDDSVIVGSAAYMSPEQANGEPVDARSDIFSLGAVLYELATGKRAFEGKTRRETRFAITHTTPQPVDSGVSECPHTLSRIVSRCLEKSPERRYQRAIDVARDLSRIKP
jgi:serine/threonine protein kinase